MCASSSDSEEICIGLPCARHWADVEERPGRSSQFCLLCDRSWKGCGDTQQRFMCAGHPGQYFYCYDVLSTCITLGSAGCVGSIMELQLFLDTKQLLSLKKNNSYNGQKKVSATLVQNQPGLAHQEPCSGLPGSAQRHLVVKRATTT